MAREPRPCVYRAKTRGTISPRSGIRSNPLRSGDSVNWADVCTSDYEKYFSPSCKKYPLTADDFSGWRGFPPIFVSNSDLLTRFDTLHRCAILCPIKNGSGKVAQEESMMSSSTRRDDDPQHNAATAGTDKRGKKQSVEIEALSRTVRVLLEALPTDPERKGVVFPVSRERVPAFDKWQRCRWSLRSILNRINHKSMLGMALGEVTGLIVVDLDLKNEPDESRHEDIVSRTIERFGETPFRVRTPSGGWHFYYRYSGERSGYLNKFSLPGEIKSDGVFVVIPPSIKGDGHGYHWEGFENPEDGWAYLIDNLDDLPPLRKGALELPSPAVERPMDGNVHAVSSNDGFDGRNISIFDALRKLAFEGDGDDALRSKAVEMAEEMNISNPKDHPVTENEALNAANQVIGYRERGELRPPGCEPYARVAQSATGLEISDTAFRLWITLEVIHGASPSKGFCIVGTAMNREQVIPGWPATKYDRARKELVEVGILNSLYQGGAHSCVYHPNGSKKGDASLYRLDRHPISPFSIEDDGRSILRQAARPESRPDDS